MAPAKVFTVVILCILVLSLGACNGGGGSPAAQLKIVSINLNPATANAGSVVQLTATYSGVSGGTSSLVKNWTVSSGTVSTTKPDFSLILRGTAKVASASSASTTASTVYWITPLTATSATVKLEVSGQSKTITANVTASPITMSVTDGTTAGTKVCTVSVTNITDLYQVAFRINYSSAWKPTDKVQGDFLGTPAQTLFLCLTNQNGFVPCALTRLGNVPGNDGSGDLAQITFAPATGTSSTHGASEQPFDLGLVMLRTSKDEPIALK
jgi:hypothetical protein